MRLHLQNINIIAEADIVLDGLTVIVGSNDSGKSTVGRLLFSSVKAMSTALDFDAKSMLSKHVKSLYRRINSYIGVRDEECMVLFPNTQSKFKKLLQETDDINQFINKRMNYIDSLDLAPTYKAFLRNDLDNISICLEYNGTGAPGMAAEIRYFIESEFMNSICSHGTQQSKVELYMGSRDENHLFYVIEKNRLTSVTQHTGMDYLRDATYVESPLYTHIIDAIDRSADYREGTPYMIPNHVKDLVHKVKSRLNSPTPVSQIINSEISQMLGGTFRYEPKSGQLHFEKDGYHYNPINIASGMKAFGLIQLLYNARWIDTNRILIWDEPENHLHPAWQVRFAELVVSLSKSGIPILLTTHSPYFLQAIRYFSAKHNIEKYVNYYHAQPADDDLTRMHNVTGQLNEVFAQLVQPLNVVMNVDEVRAK